jgi:hypothetical protein
VCNEAGSSSALWLTAFVLPLLGFLVIWIAGIPFRFDVPVREFNPLVFIPVVASIAGLFVLIQAAFITVRGRRFGVSTLTLDSAPRPGGSVRGRVTCTIEVPASDWRFLIQRTDSVLGGGKHQSLHQDVVTWTSESALPGAAHSLITGVPVDMAIPSPPAGQKDPRTRWVLTLTGARPGLDYRATFRLPIRST